MYIILLGLIVSITLFFFVIQKSKIETKNTLLFEKWFDTISNTANYMYYFYVPGAERPLVVLLSDLISFGSDGKVYYGWKYGEINVSEIVKNYLGKSLGSNWKFVTNKVSYGTNLECENILVYEMLIPIPSYTGGVVHAKIYKCV